MGQHKNAARGGTTAQKGTSPTLSSHGGEAGDTGEAGHDLRDDVGFTGGMTIPDGVLHPRMPFRFKQLSQLPSKQSLSPEHHQYHPAPCRLDTLLCPHQWLWGTPGNCFPPSGWRAIIPSLLNLLQWKSMRLKKTQAWSWKQKKRPSLQLEKMLKPEVELEEWISQLGIMSVLPMQLSCIRGEIKIVLDAVVLTILWKTV